jgi:hypothetical protein
MAKDAEVFAYETHTQNLLSHGYPRVPRNARRRGRDPPRRRGRRPGSSSELRRFKLGRLAVVSRIHGVIAARKDGVRNAATGRPFWTTLLPIADRLTLRSGRSGCPRYSDTCCVSHAAAAVVPSRSGRSMPFASTDRRRHGKRRTAAAGRHLPAADRPSRRGWLLALVRVVAGAPRVISNHIYITEGRTLPVQRTSSDQTGWSGSCQNQRARRELRRGAGRPRRVAVIIG